MTESSSGLDELENRIQRRERSVRPPRKPRTDVGSRSGEPPDDGEQQNDDAPSGAATASANGETQPEAEQMGEQEANQPAEPSEPGDAGQQPEAASSGTRSSGEAGSPGQDLQKQIADAIAPVVDDLQRQIADIVRQQMQEAGEMNRQAPQSQEAETTEGAESHQTASGDQSTQQDQKPEKSPLSTAVQQVLAATRQAFRWLVNALRRAWRALMNGLRAIVVNVILGIAKSVLKVLIRGLIHRLEGKPESKGTDSERPEASASSA